MQTLKPFRIWRILEPIFLGVLANITVNFFFNPKNPDFILQEFIVAIIFSVPIVAINNFISKKLEKKFHWIKHFKKRFLYQLLYLAITLAIVLNIFGNWYVWIIGDDFYTTKELVIINLSAFTISLFLTTLKWLVQFYSNWKKAENNLENSNKELDKIKTELHKETDYLKLYKKNKILKVDIHNIVLAKSEFGVIWVYYNNDKAVFSSSLAKLFELLPKHLFFKANRNIILRKDSILSIQNSTYGKIEIILKKSIHYSEKIIISRLKASSFRKWYTYTT